MNTNAILTQSFLVEREADPDPTLRSKLLAAMAVAVDALRLCRTRKLTRDAHARQYRANPDHFKAKAKAFRTSPEGKAYYN
jgi:hypothetical protein